MSNKWSEFNLTGGVYTGRSLSFNPGITPADYLNVGGSGWIMTEHGVCVNPNHDTTWIQSHRIKS